MPSIHSWSLKPGRVISKNQEGIMRDPKRIPETLKEIEIIWNKNPDLRLVQLLLNVMTPFNAPYYIEDDKLLKKLKDMYK